MPLDNPPTKYYPKENIRESNWNAIPIYSTARDGKTDEERDKK